MSASTGASTKNGSTADRMRTFQNCCDKIIADILVDGIDVDILRHGAPGGLVWNGETAAGRRAFQLLAQE